LKVLWFILNLRYSVTILSLKDFKRIKEKICI